MAGLFINGYFTTRIRAGLLAERSKQGVGLYVLVTLDSHCIGRTKTASGSNPQWEFEKTSFLHGYLQAGTTINFTLLSQCLLRADIVIGSLQVLVGDLLNHGSRVGHFPLSSEEDGTLVMELTYAKEGQNEDEQFADAPKYNVTNIEAAPTPVSSRGGTGTPSSPLSKRLSSPRPSMLTPSRMSKMSSPRPSLLGASLSPRNMMKQSNGGDNTPDAQSGANRGFVNGKPGRSSGILTPRRVKDRLF